MSLSLLIEQVDPWALPSVSLKSKNLLPDIPGIYFALTDSELLYIGKAKTSLRLRWANHHRAGCLSKVKEVKIAYLDLSGQTAHISELEAIAIKLLNPSLNRTPTGNSLEDRRRIQIDLPIVPKLKLYLSAAATGLTKTEMAERILIDRVSNVDNWQEVIKDLKIEAAIARMPLQEFVCQLLSKDNEFSALPLQDIDWLPLLQSEEPSTDALLKLLEEGNIEDAIAYLKGLKS